MSENPIEPEFQLLSDGQESTAMPVDEWYKLQDSGKVKVVKDFSNGQFGIFEDETGQAVRVNIRKRSEGIVSTAEKLPEFANIVSITPEEKEELIK